MFFRLFVVALSSNSLKSGTWEECHLVSIKPWEDLVYVNVTAFGRKKQSQQ